MPLFQTTAAGGGGSSRTLIQEFTAVGDETEVIITGLDMVADGGKYEVDVDFDYNSYSNATDSIKLNGEYTSGYGSYFNYTASVVTTSGVSNISNNNFPAYQMGYQGTKMTIYFTTTATGKVFFTYKVDTITGTGTVRTESYAVTHLGTNITAIRIGTWLGLKAGSTLKVYTPA